jgi:galactokinase
MALLGQRAEREWVGVQCGIMDQLTAACGREGHALLIDCRSLDVEPIPLPEGLLLVVLDTGTRRSLADSEYNRRREECEAAARICGVHALRDLTLDRLQAMREAMGPLLYRRARHVVSENRRVQAAARALRQGDAGAVGALLLESHASLARDYEVSSPALDAMVESARQAPGCLGARLTGAGFGGAVIALVRAQDVDAFTRHVLEAYGEATGHQGRIYACRAVGGAEVVWKGG